MDCTHGLLSPSLHLLAAGPWHIGFLLRHASPMWPGRCSGKVPRQLFLIESCGERAVSLRHPCANLGGHVLVPGGIAMVWQGG